VVIEIRLYPPKTLAKSLKDIRVERNPLPMRALPSGENATVYEINVLPSAPHNFRTSQSGALH